MPPTTRRPGRFAVLLAAFFALFGVPTVVDALRERRGEGDGAIGQLVLVGALITLLIASASAASTSRRTRLVAGAFAAATIFLQVAGLIVQSTAIVLTGHIVLIGFLSYTTWTILRTLFRPAAVDLETICASLCSYLLLGLIWSVAYSFVATLDPTAFRLPGPDQTMRLGYGGGIDALYFSYVTLTTLGYGDIVPVTQAARTLAFTEAMVGQLLLVVLVARLVGLNVAQQASRTASAPAASGPEICS